MACLQFWFDAVIHHQRVFFNVILPVFLLFPVLPDFAFSLMLVSIPLPSTLQVLCVKTWSQSSK